MWVLTCDMEKSHGQLEMVISPLSFGLPLMFPTQSGFRRRDSLLSVFKLTHAAEFTSVYKNFLPSPAEETQIIHVHINWNTPFHHVCCPNINFLFSASSQCHLNAVRHQCEAEEAAISCSTSTTSTPHGAMKHTRCIHWHTLIHCDWKLQSINI